MEATEQLPTGQITLAPELRNPDYLHNTLVPNEILGDGRLSPGARLLYGLLYRYLYLHNAAVPCQNELGQQLGVSSRSIRTFITELKHHNFLKISRIGGGAANHYHLKFVS